jgi:choline dehydrogenase-like flavoprotein
LEAQKAKGVVFRDKHGKENTVTAKTETILCAEAVGTPQLLML